jgi:hypothetical protein
MKFYLIQSARAFLFLLLVGGNLATTHAFNTDLNFEGQMKAIAEELKAKCLADPLTMGQKLKLPEPEDPVVKKQSLFDGRIEHELKTRLADLFDPNAAITLVASHRVTDLKEATGKSFKVVTLEVLLKKGGKEIGSVTREINNSSDIARIEGVTIAPSAADNTAEKRNQAVQAAKVNPSFDTHPDRPKAVTAFNSPRYAVEIRLLTGNGPQVVAPENKRGNALAPIGVGQAYEIVLLNFDDKNDAVAKVEIDGLDAANTFCIDKNDQGKPAAYPGYLIPKAVNGQPGEHVVPGWLHTVNQAKEVNAFQFLVTELGKGAESARKPRSAIGMIHVRFYEAALTAEALRPRTFGETDKGMGLKLNLRLESRVLATEPDSSITIRYNRDGNPPALKP